MSNPKSDLRPPARTKVLSVRLNPKDWEEVGTFCERQGGLPPSALARAVLLDVVRDHSPLPKAVRQVTTTPAHVLTSDALAMRMEVKRVGVNLNQIAFRMNRGQSVSEQVMMRTVMEARDVMRELLTKLGEVQAS